MTADHINHADRIDNGEHAIIAVEHVTFGYKKNQTVLEDIDHRAAVAAIARIQRRRQDHAVQAHRRTAAPREGRIDRRRVPSMRDVFQMTEKAISSAR